MLTTLVIALVVSFFTEIFSMFPIITKLPTIGTYDLDAQISQYIGVVHHFLTDFWPIYDAVLGALFILAYFGAKVLLRIIMGSRAPGHYG